MARVCARVCVCAAVYVCVSFMCVCMHVYVCMLLCCCSFCLVSSSIESGVGIYMYACGTSLGVEH